MLIISNKILGAKGSMSEVGIPPPHNSDKPQALVARNYHTITASAAEVMINLMIWEMVRTGLFHMVAGSFSDKNMWAPEQLWSLDSL